MTGGTVLERGVKKTRKLILIKLNGNGDMVWVRLSGNPGHSRGNEGEMTNDGDYIIAGETDPGGIYVMKTDANGKCQGLDC